MKCSLDHHAVIAGMILNTHLIIMRSFLELSEIFFPYANINSLSEKRKKQRVLDQNTFTTVQMNHLYENLVTLKIRDTEK